MRRRDIYWSLFHKPEKRQIDDLRTDDIEIIHEILPKTDHVQWLVWREGFNAWKPLADFPELIVSLRQANQMKAPSIPAPPPVAPRAERAESRSDRPERSEPRAEPRVSVQQPRAAEVTTDIRKETIAATTVQDRLQRQSSLDSEVEFEIADDTALGDRDARYARSWEFRILTSGKPILNKTVDISTRGMALLEALPKNLPKYFNVELHVHGVVIPLVCSELPPKPGKPSNRVKIEVNHQPSLLVSTLISYDK